MHTKSKKLTWSNANLQNPSERDALFLQEERKAARRIKQAFDKLKAQHIVDEHGDVISTELPKDMQPNSQCDFEKKDLQEGLDDVAAGRVSELDEAFARLKSRFSGA